MADESISYEMLQDMLRTERRSNKLTPVNTRFWHDVRDFLGAVMDTFRAEQAKDPFSRRVMMVTDEVKHARQAAEGIWALRERKMSLWALAQVREESPKRPEGLTPEEEKIFDHILTALKAGRQAILETGKPPETPAPVTPAAPTPVQPDPQAAEPAEPAPEPVKAAPPEPTTVPADTPDVDMIMIRATSDIPAFVGPDMQTYLLKTGDIATVPEPIAKLLERRKKAVVVQAQA